MNTLLETMPSPAHEPQSARTILHDHRMKATVVQVNAGEEIDLPLDATAHEHLLVVIQGRATVRVDELSHVLNLEQAMHLTGHEPVAVWNHGEIPAKLLRIGVQLPPPPPPIVTMPRP